MSNWSGGSASRKRPIEESLSTPQAAPQALSFGTASSGDRSALKAGTGSDEQMTGMTVEAGATPYRPSIKSAHQRHDDDDDDNDDEARGDSYQANKLIKFQEESPKHVSQHGENSSRGSGTGTNESKSKRSSHQSNVIQWADERRETTTFQDRRNESNSALVNVDASRPSHQPSSSSSLKRKADPAGAELSSDCIAGREGVAAADSLRDHALHLLEARASKPTLKRLKVGAVNRFELSSYEAQLRILTTFPLICVFIDPGSC